MLKTTLFKILPNSLTIFRIVAIPFFIVSLVEGRSVLALFIFIGACLSDYFDGMLARKYKNITKFGQLMDPLADKFLVLSAMILLCIKPISYIHWSVTFIITLREIIITILRSIYLRRKILIPANNWGKIKTIFQMTGIIGSLLSYAIFKLGFVPTFEKTTIIIIQVYFWIVLGITILSGWVYFKNIEKHQKYKKLYSEL